MKSFLKYTAATVVGIFLCSIILFAIGMIAVAGMAVSENTSKPITEKSVLRLNLSGQLSERRVDTPMAMFGGDDLAGQSLEELLMALDKAKDNDNVVGVYVEAGALLCTPGMLQELRQALADLKASGKFVLAYGETMAKSSYYVASCADKVMLNPVGMLDWSGLASMPMFYAGAMEKLGVKMQVFKVGTFKSAVEPYINTEMSPANREQVSSYLNNMWKNMVKDVAESRGLTPETVNALADTLVPLVDPALSVEHGLVDTLCYLSDVKTALKEMAGFGEDEKIKFVSPKEVAYAETLGEKITEQIAVYYAAGEIVQTMPGGFQPEASIVGDQVVKDLQKLRKDDDVKAVVLRVNSPGGSAYASEQIWHEVELLKEAKPVVVSMGGAAASGGYYISCSANKIFAEPMTLTGSIGIFAMIPEASELMTKKIGLTSDVVKTNAMSDFGGDFLRPFNEMECKLMQEHVNNGYELFTSRVANGRNMPQDEVKKVGEGRVWTGEQALELGLVDQLGGLNDAIAAAAELAGAEAYNVGRYPKPAAWYDNLLNKAKGGYLSSEMKSLMGEYYDVFSMFEQVRGKDPVQARVPYIIRIK